MNSDIALAFAHPAERAAATAPDAPRDRLSLRDHVVEAEIGAFQQERGHRQRVRFNVVVEVRPAPAPLLDDVDRILSYDRITEAIATELAAERVNLLETLAERIAARILAAPAAERVFVRVEKLDIGPYALGVEIVRARDQAVPEVAEGPQRQPVIACLSNAVIEGGDLGARLDAFAASGGPVVMSLGLPDGSRPQTGHRATQRRIDLLAIEQNAWTLAARDARCVVVAARTEIDWAVAQGRMIVWAPSKLVLDSGDGPASLEAGVLAGWLADLLNASRVELHGDMSPPAACRAAVVRA